MATHPSARWQHIQQYLRSAVQNTVFATNVLKSACGSPRTFSLLKRKVGEFADCVHDASDYHAHGNFPDAHLVLVVEVVCYFDGRDPQKVCALLDAWRPAATWERATVARRLFEVELRGRTGVALQVIRVCRSWSVQKIDVPQRICAYLLRERLSDSVRWWDEAPPATEQWVAAFFDTRENIPVGSHDETSNIRRWTTRYTEGPDCLYNSHLPTEYVRVPSTAWASYMEKPAQELEKVLMSMSARSGGRPPCACCEEAARRANVAIGMPPRMPQSMRGGIYAHITSDEHANRFRKCVGFHSDEPFGQVNWPQHREISGWDSPERRKDVSVVGFDWIQRFGRFGHHLVYGFNHFTGQQGFFRN